jgi:hypothetical protein
MKDLIQKDDNKVLHEIILWTSQFFDQRRKIVMDLHEMLRRLGESDRAAVVAEVDAWIAFKRKEREHKERNQKCSIRPPMQKKIPALLVTPFMEKIKEHSSFSVENV